MWRDEVGCSARREPVRRWSGARDCVLVATQLTDPRMRRRTR